MDDAVGVAGGQRVGDLRGQQRGGDRREGAVVVQVAVEIRAVDQVHDEGEEVALDHQVAGADDVGVGEAEQDGALPQEAHHHVRIVCQLLLEHLDRDHFAGVPGHGRLGARRFPLTRAPDGARRAASERLLEQVLAAYRPHVMRSLIVIGTAGAASVGAPSAHCNAVGRKGLRVRTHRTGSIRPAPVPPAPVLPGFHRVPACSGGVPACPLPSRPACRIGRAAPTDGCRGAPARALPRWFHIGAKRTVDGQLPATFARGADQSRSFAGGPRAR